MIRAIISSISQTRSTKTDSLAQYHTPVSHRIRIQGWCFSPKLVSISRELNMKMYSAKWVLEAGEAGWKGSPIFRMGRNIQAQDPKLECWYYRQKCHFKHCLDWWHLLDFTMCRHTTALCSPPARRIPYLSCLPFHKYFSPEMMSKS